MAASSEQTRAVLGWNPTHPTLFADLARRNIRPVSQHTSLFINKRLDIYPAFFYDTAFLLRPLTQERHVIGRLRGIILEKQPPLVLMEVGGVGYEVHMPMTCFYELPEAGKEAVVFTHFVVREDAHLLFGFNNKQERTLFRELIKTNGVGPKLALAIFPA
jgi:Holliday junction DNA helicase RuvA